MKTMFVFKLPTPASRPQRYARMASFNRDHGCKAVESIDEASKFSDPVIFERTFPGVPGEAEQVSVVLIEQKHQAAMRFLKDLLDKEIAFAKEQEETAHLPEDRKDACRDYEKMELIKELFGL